MFRHLLRGALGVLHYAKSRSLDQHLAAATIRDTIQGGIQYAAGKSGSIEIVAQDPAYDEQCTRILREELSIRAVTDLTGFRSITQNTFVISMAPGAPMLQAYCRPYSGMRGTDCHTL
jgi:hypothetical protein